MISGCQDASTYHIDKNNDLSGINEISYDSLKEKMKSKETFIIFLGRNDCPDCKAFKPILSDYLQKNKGMYVYYLDLKQYRDAAKSKNATKKEKDFYDSIYKTFDIDWVPSLRLINNGEVKDKYQYLTEEYYSKDAKGQKEDVKKYTKELQTWLNKIFKEK